MYVYNLTCAVERGTHKQWLNWIKQEYIAKVYETNQIKSVRIFKILNTEDNITYALHHETASPQDLQEFIQKDVPTLIQLSRKCFGDKVLMFGTTLKEISLQTTNL